MSIRATKVAFLEDVVLEMTFQDGKVIRYDMSKMFSKYPQLIELRNNRELFVNGHLDPGGFGVIWNDDLDFEAAGIYEFGTVVRHEPITINQQIGLLLIKAREESNMTQMELSKLSNIDQGDISKIEKGLGNPTIAKINKLFKAMNKNIQLELN